MGCDIHTKAEIRHDYGNGPYWKAVTVPVFKNPYYSETSDLSVWNYPYQSEPYSGRNYDLFAFLADVRNGRGFAGVYTGERITPVAEPRGVPNDASKKWKKYVKRWGSDLHSTSYFTLAELEAADWDQTIIKSGVLTALDYERIRDSGFILKPESWSGGVSGGGIITITPEQYDAGERGDGDPTTALDQSDRDPKNFWSGGYKGKTYVQYRWTSTVREMVGDSFFETMATLAELAPRIGEHPDLGVPDTRPKDHTAIRLVFGFDN